MKLEEMLTHSIRTVPHYRGLNLTDACTLQDFPLLDRQIISGRSESFLSECYSHDELTSYRTSGTTGFPLQFYMHRGDRARAALALWGARRWYGIRSPSEPTCRFYRYAGYELTETQEPRLTRINRRVDWRRDVMQFNAYDLTSDAFAEYWHAMNDHAPRWFQGPPSVVGRFASWMLDRGNSGAKSIRPFLGLRWAPSSRVCGARSTSQRASRNSHSDHVMRSDWSVCHKLAPTRVLDLRRIGSAIEGPRTLNRQTVDRGRNPSRN